MNSKQYRAAEMKKYQVTSTTDFRHPVATDAEFRRVIKDAFRPRWWYKWERLKARLKQLLGR